MELCLPVFRRSEECEFSIKLFQIEILLQISLFSKGLMSQVYMSNIMPVIANTFLLGSFYLSVFQNLHCDEKSSVMHSNVSTLLFIYFIYLFICSLFCLFI